MTHYYPKLVKMASWFDIQLIKVKKNKKLHTEILQLRENRNLQQFLEKFKISLLDKHIQDIIATIDSSYKLLEHQLGLPDNRVDLHLDTLINFLEGIEYAIIFNILKNYSSETDQINIFKDNRFYLHHERAIFRITDLDQVLTHLLEQPDRDKLEVLSGLCYHSIFHDAQIPLYSRNIALTFLDKYKNNIDITNYLTWYLNESEIFVKYFDYLDDYTKDLSIPRIIDLKFLQEQYFFGKHNHHTAYLLKNQINSQKTSRDSDTY